ncbi:hypothetical protein Tsubulata_041228 [Turnera subulata]|uniref:FHA domain-containing protein n=1 Tax=Turnera subulata TaxID=218843 RepID=A0A9Q0FXM7_9ROSI|nr:hypothetical protein Tsubulata_041228 [Turnera subulata]
MEIEGEDGVKISLATDTATVIGRGSGFNTGDRTVSRRHVLFQPPDKGAGQPELRASFQVIGKNPVWVRSGGESGSETVKVFRSLEKGEVAAGDWLCVSSQSPVWFRVKVRDLESDSGSEICQTSYDLSEIDPVKEFGFLVIGHEFDGYPKQRIRDPSNWDWFLEEATRGSEDEDDESFGGRKKVGKGKRKKNKGGGNDEDDDWSVESEDDEDVTAKMRKIGSRKYMTRSKEGDRTNSRDKERKKGSGKKKSMALDEEDDETLGGFIVNDVDEDEGGEGSDEEDEFIEEDDDDDED